MLTDTLGRRIAALRNERRMTQAALAAEAGISVTFLSEIENDHRGIGVDTLERIASALNASLDYLVRGTTAAPERDQSISTKLADLALRVRVLECGHPVDRMTGKPMTQANLDALYEMMDELAVRGEEARKEVDRLQTT